MAEQFYIFLDIDGVLNHASWFKLYVLKDLDKRGFHLFFCPWNIKNLNVLLGYLKSNGFVPKIVITSTWRISDKDFAVCKKMLPKYGLCYDDEFDRTSLKPKGIRGRQILNYLSLNHANKNNFVVIDDKSKYIDEYFKKENLIKTSGLFKRGLTLENVQSFISAREKTLRL